MDANKLEAEAHQATEERDRLLRRAIGLFAVASVVALALAVGTAAWHQNTPGGGEPNPLAADTGR
jgi:ferric-dicitrate binding protein FerR (iron transport regulator)